MRAPISSIHLALAWPLLAAAMAAPAVAQPNCAPHAEAVADLAAVYGEHRHALMLEPDGTILEVYGVKGGSWSILRTGPDGIACIVAHGVGFTPVRDPLPNTDDPA